MPETNDPEYYRSRVASARAMAEAAQDPAIKAIHARMASDYELLASDASQRNLRVVKEA
jgi:hypothetical protein